MMLLPSALPCEASQGTPKATTDKLISLPHYQHPPCEQSVLQSSCRALQAILRRTSLPSAHGQYRPILLREPLQPRQHNARILEGSGLKPQTSRGKKKRRRDEFEQETDSVQGMGCELPQRFPSTPKRRRKIPLSMPLGLSADDFLSLDPTRENFELNMPQQSPNAEDDHDWTMDDDRILVETVLEKLRLSKTQWNECARILGKDRDSLGKRWQLLVGKGGVGLRRGRRMERPELDIHSW